MFSRLIQLCRKLFVPLTWSIVTQILLSIPGNLLEGNGVFHIPQLDKVAHVGLFGGLSLLWSLYLYFKNGAGRKVFLLVAMAVSIYGVAIEYYQFYFIPMRSFDVYDIVADVCGALCGFLATMFVVNRWPEKKVGKQTQ